MSSSNLEILFYVLKVLNQKKYLNDFYVLIHNFLRDFKKVSDTALPN